MGILGNLFGGDNGDSGGSDWGTRLALMGQVLMAADQGQVANIAPSLAVLNERRRKVMDEAKSQKWLQNQAAAMADKNPRLAAMLQDPNTPPEVGQGLIAQYIKTLPEFQLPDWKTFDDGTGNVMRYDANNPNSKPELFFDGPQDPFKALIEGALGVTSGAPPRPSTPTASAATPSGATSGEPAPMPAATGSDGLNPQMKILAQSFGLPENATKEDIMSVAQAGLISKDQAAATAEAIRKKYSDEKNFDFNATKQQTEVAFKLQDDYWKVGQTYQKVLDTAQDIANLPDDPNGFERLMTLYKYMRTLDPQGAVRESDAALAQNASGPYQALEQLFQKYGNLSGGDIPLDAALEMKRLILQLGETTSQADYKVRQKIIKRGKALGLPEDKIPDMVFGALQDSPDLMQGYTPRFEVPARKTDEQLTAKTNESFDLDPSQMKENVIYAGDDGRDYKLVGGQIFVEDGKGGWRVFK